MNNSVVSAIVPVVLLTAIGFFAGRRHWLRAEGLKQLSSLVFVLLTPPLLFRTMVNMDLAKLDFRPLIGYFLAAALIFLAVFAFLGYSRRSAVLGLACTYTNAMMIGVPLIGLAYGSDGLVTLFTLVSVHSLVMLTSTTVLLEMALLKEDAAAGVHSDRHIGHTVLAAVRNTLVHPVPLPIMAGLLFAWAGIKLPPMIDTPLMLLGNAFGPLALILVGATLAATPIGEHWRAALGLSLVKTLGQPALVALVCWLLGLTGMQLAVIVLAAALPTGANVFLFAQRYRVAEELSTSCVAMSTLISLATLTLVMLLLPFLP